MTTTTSILASLGLTAGLAGGMAASTACAQPMPIPRIIPVPAGGMEGTLPYRIGDGNDVTWMVMPGGRLNQQGNMPMFAQAAVLTINGGNLPPRQGEVAVDPKTGELLLGGLRVGQVTVARRIRLLESGDLVVADTFSAERGDGGEITVSLTQSLNFGVQSSEVVKEPKKPGRAIGYAAMTHNNVAAMHVVGMPRARDLPAIPSSGNNNTYSVVWKLQVRPEKPITLINVYGSRTSLEQAREAIEGMGPREILDALPREIRGTVSNLAGPAAVGGEIDMLRGDASDVIELRGGDRLIGTIEPTAMVSSTDHGKVKLDPADVLGLLSPDARRGRQLIVTRDGEVIGGQLEQQTVPIVLASGMEVDVPVASIARLGFRKRTDDPETLVTSPPFVVLRSEDRLRAELPKTPVPLVTRFGRIDVPAAMIHRLRLSTPLGEGQQLLLRNGTSMFALPAEASLSLTLLKSAVTADLRYGDIAGLFFGDGDEPPVKGGSLTTTDGDLLAGMLDGPIELETGFDRVQINGQDVRLIDRPDEDSPTLSVETWEGTRLSATFAESSVRMDLGNGLMIAVPVALIDRYTQPVRKASPALVEEMTKLVADLSHEDWRERDQAQKKLTAMGLPIAEILTELRGGLPAEARQRLDAVLRDIGAPGTDGGDKPGDSSGPPEEPFEGVQDVGKDG